MSALRTTRTADPLFKHFSRIGFGLLLGVFGVCGCENAPAPQSTGGPASSATPLGANDPNWLTSRPLLPAPDIDHIEYNKDRRSLSFYDLPGGDRWMVQLPGEQTGRLVGPQHMLPEATDNTRTFVYYVRPGVKSSAAVSVAEIESGRAPHTSFAVNR
jgi:hypothetical protein